MRRRTGRTRLLDSLIAGIKVAVVVALGLTIADLYQTGHGMPSIGRPWLDVEQVGIHLSRADVIVLVAALLGAGFTWRGRAADSA